MDRYGGLMLLTVVALLCVSLSAGVEQCGSGQFGCSNQKCVSVALRCDGTDHCGDASDEILCPNCTALAFHCMAAGRCVPAAAVCDGRADCPDEADEWSGKCAPQKPAGPKADTCSVSEFHCSNGPCIPYSWKCDHHRDCADGSDEENCDQNECELNNGGCSHECVDLPLGFKCVCPVGMKLMRDTHCEEIDHCLDRDVCDQICVHCNGSVTCDCHIGYLKGPEEGRCLATGTAAGLVFSSGEGIGWMDTSGSEQRQIATNSSSPGAVAVFMANSSIYYSDPQEELIYRLSIDKQDDKPGVFLRNTSGIVGLTVDWIHECLYWTSTSTRAIHVAALNGSERRTLIPGLSRPTAVTVQPLQGLLFWADAGVSPRIERSGLHGQDRRALVTSLIRSPVAITLDIARDLLYWADSGLHMISRVRFDGQQRKTVVESNGYLDQPFAVAVFESRVYWSDRLMNSLCSADKHSGVDLRVTRSSASNSPVGLTIYHHLLQPTDPAQSPSASVDANSAFIWILSLIVFLCVLLASMLLWWCRTELSPPPSLTAFQEANTKESQDPLLTSGHTHTVSDQHFDTEGTVS